MKSEPLRLIRAQKAAIIEVARLAELRVPAVQAERLARLDQNILRLKYREARESAAADQVPKRSRPQIAQALPARNCSKGVWPQLSRDHDPELAPAIAWRGMLKL